MAAAPPSDLDALLADVDRRSQQRKNPAPAAEPGGLDALLADVDRRSAARQRPQPAAASPAGPPVLPRLSTATPGVPQPVTYSTIDGTARSLFDKQFNTILSSAEEQQFKAWKARYAPHDSGADYDLRGAFKTGLRPDQKTGHWPDTFKKPNHPTFSNESQYAPYGNPGHWQGEQYIPGGSAAPVPPRPDYLTPGPAKGPFDETVVQGHQMRAQQKNIPPTPLDVQAMLKGTLGQDMAAMRQVREPPVFTHRIRYQHTPEEEALAASEKKLGAVPSYMRGPSTTAEFRSFVRTPTHKPAEGGPVRELQTQRNIALVRVAQKLPQQASEWEKNDQEITRRWKELEDYKNANSGIASEQQVAAYNQQMAQLRNDTQSHLQRGSRLRQLDEQTKPTLHRYSKEPLHTGMLYPGEKPPEPLSPVDKFEAGIRGTILGKPVEFGTSFVPYLGLLRGPDEQKRQQARAALMITGELPPPYPLPKGINAGQKADLVSQKNKVAFAAHVLWRELQPDGTLRVVNPAGTSTVNLDSPGRRQALEIVQHLTPWQRRILPTVLQQDKAETKAYNSVKDPEMRHELVTGTLALVGAHFGGKFGGGLASKLLVDAEKGALTATGQKLSQQITSLLGKKVAGLTIHAAPQLAGEVTGGALGGGLGGGAGAAMEGAGPLEVLKAAGEGTVEGAKFGAFAFGARHAIGAARAIPRALNSGWDPKTTPPAIDYLTDRMSQDHGLSLEQRVSLHGDLTNLAKSPRVRQQALWDRIQSKISGEPRQAKQKTPNRSSADIEEMARQIARREGLSLTQHVEVHDRLAEIYRAPAAKKRAMANRFDADLQAGKFGGHPIDPIFSTAHLDNKPVGTGPGEKPVRTATGAAPGFIGPKIATPAGEAPLRHQTPEQLQQIAEAAAAAGDTDTAQRAQEHLVQHEQHQARLEQPIPMDEVGGYLKERNNPGNVAMAQANVLRTHAEKVAQSDPELAQTLRSAGDAVEQEFKSGYLTAGGKTADVGISVPAAVAPPEVSAWRKLTPEQQAALPENVRQALLAQDVHNSLQALTPGTDPVWRMSQVPENPRSTKDLTRVADSLYDQAERHLDALNPPPLVQNPADIATAPDLIAKTLAGAAETGVQPTETAAAPIAPETPPAPVEPAAVTPAGTPAPRPVSETVYHGSAKPIKGEFRIKSNSARTTHEPSGVYFSSDESVAKTASGRGEVPTSAWKFEPKNALVLDTPESKDWYEARYREAERAAVEDVRAHLRQGPFPEHADALAPEDALQMLNDAPEEGIPNIGDRLRKILQDAGYDAVVDPASGDHIALDPKIVKPAEVSPAAPEARPTSVSPQLERRTEAGAPQRKAIEEMTSAEQHAEITRLRKMEVTDVQTGLGNETAWQEVPKKQYIVSVDADSLGWANDNLSHALGDNLIKEVANVLREVGLGDDFFHTHGDEYYGHGGDREGLQAKLELADRIMGEKVLSYQPAEGDRRYFKGFGISHGIGERTGEGQAADDQAFERAEEGLKAAKRTRQELGLRGEKGQRSPRLVEVGEGGGPLRGGDGLADRGPAGPAPENRGVEKGAGAEVAPPESGAKGGVAESGFKGGSKAPQPEKQPEPLPHEGSAFENPALAEWAKVGRKQVKTPVAEQMKQHFTDFIHMALRTHRHLPPGPQFAEFSRDLSRLENMKEIAGMTSALDVAASIDHLAPDQQTLFADTLIARDLQEDLGIQRARIEKAGKGKIGLPTPWTPEKVESENKQLDRRIAADPAVTEALGKWKAVTDDAREQRLEAAKSLHGRNLPLTREDHFHRDILDFINSRAGGSVSSHPIQSHTRGGYLAGRTGSERAYSTDFIRSQGKHLADMIADTEVDRLLKKVHDQHDIGPHLQSVAAFEAEPDLAPFLKQVAATREFAGKSAAAGHPMLDRMGELAADGTLPDTLDRKYAPLIEEMGGNWQINQERAAQGSTERLPLSESAVEALPGYGKWLETQRKGKTVKGGMVARVKGGELPKGYEWYQPEEGTFFYKTWALPDAAAAKLAEGGPEALGLEGPQARQIVAMGRRKKAMALPSPLVRTLEEFGGYRKDPVDRFLQGPALWARSWWHQVTLLSPGRWGKYNVNNMFGDADPVYIAAPEVLGNAKQFPSKWVRESIGELRDLLYKNKGASQEIRDWIEQGGMAGTLQAAERMGDLKALDLLAKFSDERPNIARKVWNGYWKHARLSSDFREAILRLAAYKYANEKMAAGEFNVFGATRPDELLSIQGRKQRAYVFSDDMLGAYDRTTALGRWVSKAVPFWRFKDVNWRRWYQIGMNHGFNNPRYQAAVGRRLAFKIGGAAVAAKLGPAIAMGLGGLALKLSVAGGMGYLWNQAIANRLGIKDSDLPQWVRGRPHLILGRNPLTGKVMAYTQPGSMPQAVNWLGFDNIFGWGDVVAREGYPGLAREMARSMVSETVGSIGPWTALYDAYYGRARFPDPLEPRAIRDKTEYLADQVQLGGLYRYMRSRPQRPGTFMDYGLATVLGATEVDIPDSNYQEMYGVARDFLQREGKGGTPAGGYSPKTNALYQFKKSLRYGDTKGAERFLLEYGMRGGTDKDLEGSLKSLEPLGGFNRDMQDKFLKSLNADDESRLRRAYQHWQNFTAPHAPTLNLTKLPIAQFVDQMRSVVASGIKSEHRLQSLSVKNRELLLQLQKTATEKSANKRR